MPKNPSPEPASILDTVNMLDTMTTDSSDSDSEVEPPLSGRLYSTKPRNFVQRRATITGASPTTKHGIDIEQFWKELKQEHNTTFQLRDKAASCAHGLDNVPINIRPQTCLGLESAKRRKKTDEQADDKKVQFTEKSTDAEGTHLDDAKRILYDVKERITSMQSCNDGSAANKDTNREHLQAFMDNVGNSNNLNNTTVPLDECNNFISDTCSISKNASGDKESETRYIKERGKLDKSHSTPAYDLSDTESKEDRKLLFQAPFCKLDLPVHCSNNVSNSSSTKTDVRMFAESADHRKPKNASQEHKEASVKRCGGNVAQKVSDIEKQIAHENADEPVRVFGVPKELDSHKNTVRITINDTNLKNNVEKSQSDIECNISDVSACDEKLNAECVCSKNSTCDCRENTDSSNSEVLDEGMCNNNSNSTERDETLQKCGKILQTVDCASTQHTKLLEKKSSVISRESSIEAKIPSSNNTNFLEDNLPNVIHNVSKIQINATPQAKEIKSADSPLAHAIVQSCRYIELPKVESVRKYENKTHLTPPEPPPRKYYTKQAAPDSKLKSTSKIPEDLEKPQVPERPDLRRDFKKADLNLSTSHVRSNSDYQDRKDFSDMGALNYPEHSMDFIDESPTINLNDTKFTQSEVSLYNENYDRSREDKYQFEKYEPFVEKFACSGQSFVDCCKSDHSPRNVECPDGVTHSKTQLTSLDLKPKLSEKDKSFEKSVVNRAMMVARSIGLSKSNSSPRSNRKRNMLLASKYN